MGQVRYSTLYVGREVDNINWSILICGTEYWIVLTCVSAAQYAHRDYLLYTTVQSVYLVLVVDDSTSYK